MSRRVPEFAVVTGVFLGLSALVTGVTLGWGLYATVVIGAGVSYPFVAFGIVRDDDPAATIRPRPVLAAGGLVAALGALGALLGNPTPAGVLFALLVGVVLFVPPAAYATRYSADVNPLPPQTTVLAGAATGFLLLVAGLFVDRPLVGVAVGGAVALGCALYGNERGVAVGIRTKRRAAVAGGLLGVGLVGVGVLDGGPLTEWLLAGAATALLPSVFLALTADEDRRSPRSR
jgi:hypothetical protein